MNELVRLLEKYSFLEDTQQGLLKALSELDSDADGFIEIEDLAQVLKSCGEPLNEEEMQQLVKIAQDESSDRPTLIDIKRLVQIMLPKIVAENELIKGMTSKEPEDAKDELKLD